MDSNFYDLTVNMSDSSAPPCHLFRLPRELRDQIYAYVFDTAPMSWLTPHIEEHFPHRIGFPASSTRRHGFESTVLFHPFPALCCASRRLFVESTPRFLTCVDTFTVTSQTARLFYEWLEQFPNDEGFKAIRDYAGYGWETFELESTQLHVDLLTRLTNIDNLHLTFNTRTILNGEKLADYDWKEEQYIWCDTGLLYDARFYYTLSLEKCDATPKYPPATEDLDLEKAVLKEKLSEFIQAHRLQVVLDLSRINSFQFDFCAEDEGQYRHNLHHPLYKWFEREWKKRGRDVCITSIYSEDYE